MESDTTHEGPCVYVLELVGNPVNSAGRVIIEIDGISLDSARLEALKAEKDAELSEYFDNACTDPACLGWNGEEPAEYMGETDDPAADVQDWEPAEGGCDKEHPFDGDWCYYNSDYSSCPTWVITTYPLL